jgi:mitochondrial enoyl-[acyl-carrier protein] reductase / trans-2-enoyl-CoA reductase
LKSLGADYIISEEDLRSKNVTSKIFKNIGEPKLALNCVGGRPTTDMVRLLSTNSTLVTYGGMSRQPLTLNTADFIFKNLKAKGFWMTQWRQENGKEGYAQCINDVLAFNELKPPKCTEIKLNNWKEAFSASKTSESSKIIFIK